MRGALRFVPSNTPDPRAFAEPSNANEKLFPDCEITSDTLESELASPQGPGLRRVELAVIDHTPFTEMGAVRPLPARRMPAIAARGTPTRKMYAMMNLRRARDMTLTRFSRQFETQTENWNSKAVR
jgi:hypothetical protein